MLAFSVNSLSKTLLKPGYNGKIGRGANSYKKQEFRQEPEHFHP